MSQDKELLRIRYEYEQAAEASLRYAHGVWGGITPHGEVELCFYTESDKLPEYSERLVAPDGSLGHEIYPGDENLKLVTRRVHSRLLLSYHTARAVLDWLQDKVDTLENEEEGIFYDDVEADMHQQ
ncbi:hypothetical protein LJC46_02940 [Desulfovibrio sp. OttesenSCG-928-G15]|nr:hypothetical protein [Desulfovibrio sp. OttesenSCG-928-G15]